jgi:hypothetical protein
MPKQIGEKSKRQQLSEIYRRRYGQEMETPSPKDIKIWEAHKALDDGGRYSELRPIIALVGMYAGYFIFTEKDRDDESKLIYVATKLRRKIHAYTRENGEVHYFAGRTSRWVFGSSPQGIVDSIIYQMVENAGYRGGGTAEISREQLPGHLRPYLTQDWQP